MSENDHILGNFGGEEATASGSVDNGAAPQRVGTHQGIGIFIDRHPDQPIPRP